MALWLSPASARCARELGARDGKIAVIAQEDSLPEAASTYDAAGKYVLPGVIDPHVHLGIYTGDFGYEAENETRAALAGGVTTVGVFMGGGESYVPQLPGLIEAVNTRASTDLFFHLSMFAPQQLDEIPQYIDMGITSFKFYMCGVRGVFPNVSDAYILDGLQRLVKIGGHLTGCVHCEDQSMVDAAFDKLAAEKPEGGLCEWSESGPAEAEELAVIRACYLSAVSGGRLYLVHQSSAAGVKAAKANRPPTVFVETTSPYLFSARTARPGYWRRCFPSSKTRATGKRCGRRSRTGLSTASARTTCL